MEVTQENQAIVHGVGEAMQAGSSGEETMLGLFADDGELIEPFAGTPQTHIGHEAIRPRYREMVNVPRPPGFLLTTNSVWMDNGTVISDWTCTADVFSSPMAGQDRYLIEGGKILRLEIAITKFPS